MESFAKKLEQINRDYCFDVPPLEATRDFTRDLVNLLFPIRQNRLLTAENILERLNSLRQQCYQLIAVFGDRLPVPAMELTDRFFGKLPGIYEILLDEADGYIKNDPAADSVEEVIMCYPGFFAVTVYRLAHALYELGVPVMPRMMTEYAHSRTGIDIHPAARIGKKFFIDHGTGVVIGETTEIGEDVKIYQGVTLGALHVDKKLSDRKRHPTIGDRVIIYAGSTILGGTTVIGHDSIIGGNVWLTSSVDPYTVVYRKPKVMYRNQKGYSEPIDWVI
ncbi:MAG: serine O-acetyltransferase EpsC [Bacteroidales bacterium]